MQPSQNSLLQSQTTTTIRMIARLINFYQWLHQPHRPLQQTQHLYCPRSRRSRFSHLPLPHQRILDCAFVESPALSVERKEVCARLDHHNLIYLGSYSWFWTRIFENQHLLDATEIFRKLNVHKKVATLSFSIYPLSAKYASDVRSRDIVWLWKCASYPSFYI